MVYFVVTATGPKTMLSKEVAAEEAALFAATHVVEQCPGVDVSLFEANEDCDFGVNNHWLTPLALKTILKIWEYCRQSL
jgi:hypothetical protein